MKRRLFNLAAAVSLGMMLAAVALWVRSYKRVDTFTNYGHYMMRGIGSDCGAIYWISQRYGHNAGRLPWKYQMYVRSAATVAEYRQWTPYTDVAGRFRWDFAGFIVTAGGAFESRAVVFPDYMIVLLTAILPTIGAVSAVRHRRRSGRGCCPICGYDLRATPERCPECGTAAGTAAGTPAAAGESRRAGQRAGGAAGR
jgi:hypothetical protein